MRELNDIIKLKIDLYEIDFKVYLNNGICINFILPIDSIRGCSKINNPNYDPSKSGVTQNDLIGLNRELMDAYADEISKPNFKSTGIIFNIYYLVHLVVKDLIKLSYNNDKELYFFQNEEGLIKIGVSNNIYNRIESLEKQLKCEIYEIKKLKFPHYERKLHKLFSNYNAYYKKQREWFTPYPELTSFIERVNNDNFIEEYNKLMNHVRQGEV